MRVIALLLLMLQLSSAARLHEIQLDNSLIRELRSDPEAARYAPNNYARQVKRGHWVPVEPTPLPSPKLIAASKKVASLLGLDPKEVHTPEFLALFSGQPGRKLEGSWNVSWAAPYALSIYGEVLQTLVCVFLLSAK